MKRVFLILLVIIVALPCLVLTGSGSEVIDADLAIVFTHDLHSHLDPFNYKGDSVGGFARIKSVINTVKDEHDNTIVLDAGDFSMGTLYQTLYRTSASEYSMLAELGFDAIAFGNHEFDYGFDAIRDMVNAAKINSTSLPPILCSNINATKSGLNENDLAEINVKEYSIFKKGDISIAIFGLLGRDAVSLSTDSGLSFDDFIESAKDTVSEINNLYSPDVIICISHSGTGEDVNNEDVQLAKEVPDIDVIISGHTHTLLTEPIIVGNTIIGSCGEYGKYVGQILLNVDDDVSLVSYSLHKINDSVSNDKLTQDKINSYKNEISDYLTKFGYESPNDILAYAPFSFPEQDNMSDSLSEQQLGNLISDSYIYAFEKAEGDNYIPIDVSVAPAGVIRASIYEGNVTVGQVFEISSLGIGNDGVAGYPLCSVYLYGRELWDLAEVDASVSSIMSYAQLYCSGLHYSINTNRMFLNRVYDCWLVDKNGVRVEIEDDRLYRVVSGLSSAKMLGTVKERSFGLLELTPKDAEGNIIDDLDSFIAKEANGSEIKEWKALADYLSSFPKGDNDVPVVPNRYSNIEGRKNVSDKFEIDKLFIHWNKISWIILSLIMFILFAIIIIIISIIKRKRKKKRASLALTED